MNKNELQKFNKLPVGWEKTTLGEVLPIVYGKGLPKAKRNSNGHCPVYGSSGHVGYHSEALTEKPALIIGRKGSVGEVHYSRLPCWPIDTTYYVEEKEYLNLCFFEYLLKGLQLAKLDKSTTIPGLSRDDYNDVQVAVAPQNEQKRIVAEIEKQFSRLDEAVDNLKRVKANLKRYKASVLKAAVEGKLTEEWRKKHPNVEPADKLLQRILAERRKKWEETELAKMKAKGKEKDDKWKKKYKEPAKPNLNDLSELQDGWLWVNIDQIMLLLTDYHANGSYKVLKKHVTILDEDAYAIYVRATNLKKNKFDSDLKFVNKKAYDFLTKSKIFGNEIIIGKIGNAGKVYCMPKLDQPCTLGMNLFMLRFNQFLSGKYIYYHLVSFFSEKEIKSKVKGVGNPSIDKNAIRSLRIALPSIREQDQIIKVVDEQISLIAHFENELERHLLRADRLRQSILKKAFSGKLVSENKSQDN